MDFVRNVNMIVNKITEDKYLLTAITTQYLYNKSSGISIEDSVQRTLDSEWCDIQKDYLFKLIGGKPVWTNVAVGALNLDKKNADEHEYLLVLLKSIVKAKFVHDYKLKNYLKND